MFGVDYIGARIQPIGMAVQEVSSSAPDGSTQRAKNTGDKINLAIEELAQSNIASSHLSYLKRVDEFNEELYPELQALFGKTAAQLILLRISNLLVSRFETYNRLTTVVGNPIGILVDPANNCTLQCPGCVHTGNQKVNQFNWPSGQLKMDDFRRLLRNFGPYAFDVYFANYGEPLLNREFPRFVSLSRRYGLPAYSSTSLSVPRVDWDAVVSSGLSFLILSIDGATEDIYSRFRKRGRFDLVLKNLEALVVAKDRLKSYTPVLHWQFLLFEHNAHEAAAAIELARRCGVNQIQLAKPYDVSWDDPSILTARTRAPEFESFHNDFRAYCHSLDSMIDGLESEVIENHFSRRWSDRLAHVSGGEQTVPTSENSRKCTWLYKCVTMDARGRLMPCARPPSKTDNLVFSHVNSNETVNSDLHQRARLYFKNSSEYRRQSANWSYNERPFCEQCEHPDTKLDISTEEGVRKHLDNFGLFRLLSEQSKQLLTNW